MIYLATKYSGEEKESFRRANEVYAKLFNLGYLVLSPISMTHPVARDHKLKGDYATWSKLNHAMIDACDEMIVIQSKGWETSEGVMSEIKYAESKGMKITYMGYTKC